MLDHRARRSLLLIDDSVDFQRLVQTFLEGSPWRCLCAADAVQATGMALRESPKVMLLDLGLPGGGGFLLLERFRANARTATIPIIITTAQTAPGLEQQARHKGAVAFLQKPFEKPHLLDLLHHVLPSASTP
ncbi:MAG: Response regulatory domain-containing protein [Nitrospira sp.]|nr:response regulator [Nitrospira sp.]ULA61783.1 MAG: Response regulatory domain-containing protein [Nitrospira sp.]